MQVPLRGHADGNIARNLLDAFNHRRIEDAAALVSEDLQWRDLPLDMTFGGKEGFRQMLQGWLAAFPNARVEVVKLTEGEDGVAAEGMLRGTHSGRLTLPGRDLAPTARPIELPFCAAMEIVHGRVFRCRTYYDTRTLLQQLGVTV